METGNDSFFKKDFKCNIKMGDLNPQVLKSHGQQCGDCWGQGDIRGLNGNGKVLNPKKIK